MKNVIVDLGNYNTKYLGENKGMFSSKISTAFNPNGEMFERVEFNGITTYITVGQLEREYSKADKNYMPILLYAISKATASTNINLCLLLPVNQLPNKERMIRELKGKSFEFRVKNLTKKVFIHNVTILPEGFVSYYSINNIENDDILIIDIGSRTVNYASFIEGNIEKNFTNKIGTYDFYSRVKEIENSKGEDYIEEDIERLIKRKKIQVEHKLYLDFLKEILNYTKGQINIKNYTVFFTGGGSLLLQKYIESNTPCKVHKEAIYSNVIGAYNLCKSVWG
ncbi:ParM/StbA family protein [Clostridium tertium]|uniref:ParM/StbA family protein n=1 Tax=Clostridium tertium TaxID=1559 RepID=UPI00189F976C|nr:ParM/StbA family protein [Clostridium tertium]MDB1947698.1 ParM/StbA family protein [Clostridium tertium]MDB1956306.1 ParM/StbA family protein [Clostridium tertium]MDB1958212.1 ParM/StbA family protein [Clostridium tertium]MDB1961602.1 ParM/StbA family protein [Clostridium tertium]MDB1967334.1 ParM/StbA family protein [Clostridium tertium]